MSQVNRPTRRPAALAPLAALVLGAGTVAQAGVVMSPHGMPAGAAQMTAADRSRCIEIEEAPGRGRTGARFVATWSRDSSCAGNAAEVAAPPAAPRADTPASTGHAAAPAPVLPLAPAVPATPSAPANAAAPAVPVVVLAAAAPADAPPPGPASAPPAAVSSDAPPPVTVAAPRDSTPLQAPSESAPPEIGVLSPEQPQPPAQGPAPGFGVTSPAHELTGIGPRPIPDARPTAPGTIPEPSSLWLLALGMAGVVWRPRRR